MNFLEAQNYLLSLNNLPRLEYLKNPRRAGIYLKRMGILLDLLNNPENKIPHYIHVTGTSGKGSICLMLNSILQSAGKKTGLITSPHPSFITERWAVNNKEMPEKSFASSMDIIKEKLDFYINNYTLDIPSFFEITTAIGLLHFANEKVEWGIIEVGLGGRNDSSNILPHKDLAIITNIGLDHTDLIGPTKADIAKEKSGIIKFGCQVITAETDNNILKIIKKECQNKKARLTIIPSHPVFTIVRQNLKKIIFIYNKEQYTLKTLGQHQITNAILAIEAAKLLGITGRDIKKGLANTRLPIRMEIVSKKPLTILDGAHNPDKMATTVQTIQKIAPTGQLHLVLGFSGDKDLAQMLKQLAVLKPATIVCTRFTSNPFRKIAEPRLIKKNIMLLLPKTHTKIFLDPQNALRWSQKNAKPNDLILVTGSIFLSGELRKIFKH